MHPTAITLLQAFACIPFIYYLLVLFSTIRFFGNKPTTTVAAAPFTPPVSNLKPVRGTDPDCYENFASFCRQDYPEYEIVFCVGDENDPVMPVINRLQQEFPKVPIRVLFGSGRVATNDKVAKLARLSQEARYEHLVISDSDVRVKPDYLRSMVAPMADPKVGAVTCFYVSTGEHSLIDEVQSAGMISDFYPGLLVAKELDGVKFALGPTIVTTRTRLAGFGGYQAIENQPGDDLLVGRLIAEDGYEVGLLPYTIETVADFQSWKDLMHKRMRWLVVMRHMRPAGHLGLLFTQGLPFAILGCAITASLLSGLGFLAVYAAFRFLITYLIGAWGLKQKVSVRLMLLTLVWDAIAFALWLTSFTRNTVRWRGGDYEIRDGRLVPAA